jgi:hypothetical protein
MSDDLFNESNRYCSFPEPGTSYTGIVMGYEKRQLNDYDSGEPDVWKDGSPKKTYVVTLQTTMREDDTDDGVRDVFCRSNLHTVWVAAAKNAGSREAVIGARMTVTYVRLNNRAKLYSVTLEQVSEQSPPEPGGQDDDDIPF